MFTVNQLTANFLTEIKCVDDKLRVQIIQMEFRSISKSNLDNRIIKNTFLDVQLFLVFILSILSTCFKIIPRSIAQEPTNVSIMPVWYGIWSQSNC